VKHPARDDYVIIQYKDEGREIKQLLKVQSKDTSKDELSGMLEHDRAYNPRTIDFQAKTIIANLGPKPVPGTAYGLRVEPWRKTRVHDFWGDVHVFRSMPKEESKALKLALDSQAEFFTRKGLGFFAPLNVEIRPPRGKYAGTYQYTGKEDVKDTLTLSPKSFGEPTKQQEVVKARKWIEYLICHEGAHGVWYRGCSNKIKARWIKAYHSTHILSSTSVSEVIKLGKSFVKAGVAIPDFRSDLDEDQQNLFDACVSWIKDYHSLNSKHLRVLIDTHDFDAIKKLWPQENILDSDFEIPLGEYASTNPEEFFAEAFSLYFATGMKIPRNIEKLLLKTTQAIKVRS
jgi:hypothetical protein